MRFAVDTTSATPIYAQLVEQAKHAIAAGSLQQGDALPSLREVAMRLRINPLTVMKAYGELETLGIAKTLHGRGTFITADSRAFSEQYRQQALDEVIDRMLVEAHHLGATFEDILARVHKRRQMLAEEPAEAGTGGEGEAIRNRE